MLLCISANALLLINTVVRTMTCAKQEGIDLAQSPSLWRSGYSRLNRISTSILLKITLTYPVTTWCRNFAALSTTSAQIFCDLGAWLAAPAPANNAASGKARTASNASRSSAEHTSASSPQRHARRTRDRARRKAARAPTRARPMELQMFMCYSNNIKIIF